jgi:hypothetical protein
VSRTALRFWGSALVLAALFTAATAYLFPFDALRLVTGPDRQRVWLLTLWTAGVMSILFGLAGLLGYGGPIGYGEVQEAGSFAEARERRRLARRDAPGFYRNFAWWLVCTGALLVAAYFAAWSSGLHPPL